MKKEPIDYQKFIEYADVKSTTLHFTKSTINLHFLTENNMEDKIFCGKTPMPLGLLDDINAHSWIKGLLYNKDIGSIVNNDRNLKQDCIHHLTSKLWNFEKYPNPFVFLTMA